MNTENPVIRVLKRRAKYGMATTEPQILDDIRSWFRAEPRKAFRDAVKEGLIVKDGRNFLGQDLWILPGHPIKKPSAAEKAANDAYVKKMMADADAYARERAAERATEQMRLRSQPPTEIRHND